MGMSLKRLLLTLAGLVVAAAVIAGFHFYRTGDIQQYLYERDQEAAKKLRPFPALPSRAMAFADVNVIPMNGDGLQSHRTVIIRGGLIEAVGPVNETAIPAGTDIVDAAGMFLIPGLSDMHVHLFDNPMALALFLANGVTSVRETGGTPTSLAWSGQIQAGEILGPNLYVTGPILGASEDSPSSRVIKTAAQGVAEVHREYDAGFRIVKPYTFLPKDAYYAIIKTAKALGMSSVGHIPYSVGLDGVIAAGQDEIAHIHSFHQDFFSDFNPAKVFSEYAIKDNDLISIADRTKAAGLRVTTTLIVNTTLLDSHDIDTYLARPMQAYEIPSAAAYMRSKAWYFNKLWNASYLKSVYLPALNRLIQLLDERSVPLVLGTDSGATGIVYGFSALEELGLLVKAGLSPRAALLSATAHAAAAVGEAGRWGTIEPGKRADVVLLRESPLTNIGAVKTIEGVAVRGAWLDRAALDSLLERVRESYR